MANREARERRGKKTKHIINRFDSTRLRLVVFRSNSHTVAQIVKRTEKGDVVLVSSSTIDKSLKSKLNGNKVEQAFIVGKTIGELAQKSGINEVAFDRSGYKYHGRVKAIAEGAREAGLTI